LEQRPYGLVTVFAANERPQRVAVAIREILWIIQVVDRREFLAPRCVAHPHRRLRIDRTDRQIFGHPLDEPERQ